MDILISILHMSVISVLVVKYDVRKDLHISASLTQGTAGAVYMVCMYQHRQKVQTEGGEAQPLQNFE